MSGLTRPGRAFRPNISRGIDNLILTYAPLLLDAGHVSLDSKRREGLLSPFRKSQHNNRQTTSTPPSWAACCLVRTLAAHKKLFFIHIRRHCHIEEPNHHFLISLVAPGDGRIGIGIVRIAA